MLILGDAKNTDFHQNSGTSTVVPSTGMYKAQALNLNVSSATVYLSSADFIIESVGFFKTVYKNIDSSDCRKYKQKEVIAK